MSEEGEHDEFTQEWAAERASWMAKANDVSESGGGEVNGKMAGDTTPRWT